MSLFKKIQKLVTKEPEIVQSPDLGRVLAPEDVPDRPDASAGNIDLDAWLERDLAAVAYAWAEVGKDDTNPDLIELFRKTVHNFHGASGAYGGGALTRLTGSLQRIIQDDDDVRMQPALINLHVQACQAASMTVADETDSIAMAVCDSLEGQVEKVLAGRS